MRSDIARSKDGCRADQDTSRAIRMNYTSLFAFCYLLARCSSSFVRMPANMKARRGQVHD